MARYQIFNYLDPALTPKYDPSILGKDVLGSGEFGIVIKGEVLFHASTEKTPVAIKMVKKSADILHFKALLSELKVLAYLGPNQNLAYLLGAWTENIENSKMHYTYVKSSKFNEKSTLVEILIVNGNSNHFHICTNKLSNICDFMFIVFF